MLACLLLLVCIVISVDESDKKKLESCDSSNVIKI